MKKAFILVNVEKEINGDCKVKTASGAETWLKADDLIPYAEFPPAPEGAIYDFGAVKINGKAYTAADIKILIQIQEGVLRQYEDLKALYKTECLS